jgi:hypothetical protein
MEELMMAEYHPYLYLDNPEILLKDQKVFSRPRALKKKVNRISSLINEMIERGLECEEIIDRSVELITAELRPSRFGYVCSVIASEFPKTFLRWVKNNDLTREILDVLQACEPVFKLLKFNTCAPEQHRIYLTITSFIRNYLKNERKRSVRARKMLFDKRIGVAQAPSPLLTAKPVSYFKSELLSIPAHGAQPAPAANASAPAADHIKTLEETQIMANKQYQINKGINKSIVFKGLKAQYIGYMGLALLIDLLFYAILYMLKVNTYMTLFLTLALGALMTMVVYHLNAHYGEHGLTKALAKRKTPKIIRSYSRRIFR